MLVSMAIHVFETLGLGVRQRDLQQDGVAGVRNC
jgi:hypothetical protein